MAVAQALTGPVTHLAEGTQVPLLAPAAPSAAQRKVEVGVGVAMEEGMGAVGVEAGAVVVVILAEGGEVAGVEDGEEALAHQEALAQQSRRTGK